MEDSNDELTQLRNEVIRLRNAEIKYRRIIEDLRMQMVVHKNDLEKSIDKSYSEMPT